MTASLTIWVDADATPREVKDVIYRAALRLEIATVMVANQRLATPANNPHVSTVLVPHGPDVADSHIAEHSFEGDVAVTADIPLAAILVERGVLVLDHRGERYTEENVRERLSVRDFMDSLRGTGVDTGGPKAYSAKDKRAFADALDRTLTAAFKKRSRSSARVVDSKPSPMTSPTSASLTSASATPSSGARPSLPAPDALELLRQGNLRFASGEPTRATAPDAATRAALAASQNPFAVVLGCADSRVIPEDVFDQPAGELFVVRVAGNVASPEAVGSIEFAAEILGTRLVVVLGHSQCGAVLATLDHIRGGKSDLSPNLQAVLNRIESSARGAIGSDASASPDRTLDAAIRANVRAVSQELGESPTLSRLARDAGLRIVGACYTLDSGPVDFIE